MPSTTILEIVDIVQETPDAISIHFPQPKINKLWYRAGQFITVIVLIEGTKHLRSYSICTERRLDDTVAITIKRQAGGLVSNFLHDQVKIGDKIELIKPMGNFYVETSVKNERHVWLFGAGSGITPLMSILRAILFHEPHSRVSLLYSNRSEEDIIFYSWLKNLQDKFPDRLRLKFWLSATKYQTGRIKTDEVKAFLDQNKRNGIPDEYFLCGPSGFMDTVNLVLNRHNIPSSKIREEYFVRGAPPVPKDIDPFAPTYDVNIQTSGSSFSILVPPGNSVLDAGLAQNKWLPHSCRQGHCSTCIGKVVAGKVSLRNNESLTADDIEAGYTLTCQAIPKSDGVVIEIGL